MALAMPTATAKMIKSAIALFLSVEKTGCEVSRDAKDDDQHEDHCTRFEVIHVVVLWLVDGRVMQPRRAALLDHQRALNTSLAAALTAACSAAAMAPASAAATRAAFNSRTRSSKRSQSA